VALAILEKAEGTRPKPSPSPPGDADPSNGGSGPSNGGSGPTNGGSPDVNVALDGDYIEVNAPDSDPVKTKVENCYHQIQKGQDIIRCDYVGMPYQDYAQAL
jgi:hypothetical protein